MSLFKKKKETWTLAHKGRIPCESRDRDYNDAGTHQGMPRIYGHHHKQVKNKEGFDSESERKYSPADTLNLDISPPEL
jgi:hypothetical protein